MKELDRIGPTILYEDNGERIIDFSQCENGDHFLIMAHVAHVTNTWWNIDKVYMCREQIKRWRYCMAQEVNKHHPKSKDGDVIWTNTATPLEEK